MRHQSPRIAPGARIALRTALSLIMLATVALSGCGDDGGEPPTPDAPVADAMGPCEPELQDPLPAANGDISGTWGFYTKFYSNVPGFSAAQISRSFYLHEYTQNGDALTFTETFCNLEVDSQDGATSIRVAQAFIDSQPPVTRTGSVAQNGADYDVSLDLSYTIRGVELTDPINEALPTEATDPRVLDQDGDGNPGLTLILGGVLRGDLYIIQRDFNEYAGVQRSEDRVEGLATWGNEIAYMGAEPPVLLDVVEAAEPDPDPNLHTFQLVRLPAGSDCSYILENRCSLFTGSEGLE